MAHFIRILSRFNFYIQRRELDTVSLMSLLLFLTVQLSFLLVVPIHSCQWSPTRCGCARHSASIHHRIVGGAEAVPHSWPVSHLNEKISACVSSESYLSGLSVFEKTKVISAVTRWRHPVSFPSMVIFRWSRDRRSTCPIGCTLF